LKEALIELLKTIFQRDNEAIDDIMAKFDYDDNHFVKPPEDVEQFVDDLLHQNQAPEVNCEFVHGHHYTEETKSNGVKIPEGSVELWFKFFDVRTRRKRIFRIGDYYLRVLNTGFDKWIYDFYIEQDAIIDKSITKTYMRAQHPHISHGNACFSAMETGIVASITNYNFSGFLWRMRSFLNSWNYRSPHWEPERFEHKVISFTSEGIKDAFKVSGQQTYPIEQNYWYVENTPKFNGKWSTLKLGLTSARLKSYDATPVSRSITHFISGAKYLNNDLEIMHQPNNNNLIKAQMLFNLGCWIQDKLNQTISLNQSLPLVCYFVDKIRAEVVNNRMLVEGEWIESYSDLNVEILNTQEIYNTEYRSEYIVSGRDYHDINPKRYFLIKESDNPDTWKQANDLHLKLTEMRRYINTLKECVIGDYNMTYNEIKENVFDYIDNIINSNPEGWKTVEEFINFVDKFSIERTSEIKNIETEMDNARINYESIKSELMNLMIEWQIKYHKTELRRLENNGRTSNVQIENLNL